MKKDNDLQDTQGANLIISIYYISRYCHSLQSCNNCIIKKWCKESRKKCPEEWTYTKIGVMEI